MVLGSEAFGLECDDSKTIEDDVEGINASKTKIGENNNNVTENREFELFVQMNYRVV